MNKSFLVLSEGKLQIRKLTLNGAIKEKNKLEAKGYRELSIAESIENA